MQRPKFKVDIDPLLHSLAEVLTPYSFSKEAPCGLSTCHQGHLHGFLVRTATGEETNIGHVCGKRHFGEDFDVANAAYHRIADRRNAVNRILTLKKQSSSVRQQVQELLDQRFGVRWVNSLIGSLHKRIGPTAFAHLAARAKSEDYSVLRVVERSEEEIVKIMRSTGKRRDQVHYVEEQVGRLPPMGWLRWDFREELVLGVSEAFKIIGELSLECETKRLNDASKACFGWEARFRRAQTHLADAQRFLGADALGITDIALEVFFTSHAEPEGGEVDAVDSNFGDEVSCCWCVEGYRAACPSGEATFKRETEKATQKALSEHRRAPRRELSAWVRYDVGSSLISAMR